MPEVGTAPPLTSDLFNSGQELGGLQTTKLLGYRLEGSLANFLPLVGWVGLFSACVPPVPGVRSGSKEVCARREVGMPFARADGGGSPTETEVRAHEGLDRGRSPQDVGRRRGFDEA